MSRSALVKVGGVSLGYLAAFVVASAAVAVRVAATSGPDAQAASGMYAFGDAVLFVFVFGVGALVPTGAALYFLRSHRGVWTAVSVVTLAIATTGIAAVILYVVGRTAVDSALATWSQATPLRMLLAPVLTPVFLVCTALAPDPRFRLTCLAATVMEAAVGAYVGIVWFLPIFLDRMRERATCIF